MRSAGVPTPREKVLRPFFSWTFQVGPAAFTRLVSVASPGGSSSQPAGACRIWPSGGADSVVYFERSASAEQSPRRLVPSRAAEYTLKYPRRTCAVTPPRFRLIVLGEDVGYMRTVKSPAGDQRLSDSDRHVRVVGVTQFARLRLQRINRFGCDAQTSLERGSPSASPTATPSSAARYRERSLVKCIGRLVSFRVTVHGFYTIRLPSSRVARSGTEGAITHLQLSPGVYSPPSPPTRGARLVSYQPPP